VRDSGDLLVLLLFNISYDRRIFSSELHRLYNAACYLVLAYTGCLPAEIVDGEKVVPSDGSWDKLFGSDAAVLPFRGLLRRRTAGRALQEDREAALVRNRVPWTSKSVVLRGHQGTSS
jgi:hypothetical protein